MTFSFRTQFLAIPAAVSILALSAGGAAAFECPKHFTAAQTMIDKVKADMGGAMSEMMPKEKMALVHALLDDAKMRLDGAKHNHAKPQGIYDHARAIAKADAALGFASAADILHFKMMKM